MVTVSMQFSDEIEFDSRDRGISTTTSSGPEPSPTRRRVARWI